MGVAGKQQVAVVKRRGSSSVKKVRRPKGTNLNGTASKSMQDNIAEIAQTLVQSAMRGNVSCLRFLVELANESQGEMEPGKTRCTRSIASELAAEPQWHSELMEGMAETGIGGREPEV